MSEYKVESLQRPVSLSLSLYSFPFSDDGVAGVAVGIIPPMWPLFRINEFFRNLVIILHIPESLRI